MADYSRSGKAIRSRLDELMQACDMVSDRFECSDCPIRHNCLCEVTVEAIWSEVSAKKITEFLEYSEESHEEIDYEAYYADMARKGERDESDW